MWICEICEMQNEDSSAVCNICGAERPVRVLFPGNNQPAPDINKTVYAPQPDFQSNPLEQQNIVSQPQTPPQAPSYGVLPDGTPIPEPRPKPANMQPVTMNEPEISARPVIEPPPFRPVEGSGNSFRWGTPAEVQPVEPSVSMNPAPPASPAVPPIRPAAAPAAKRPAPAAKPAHKAEAASKNTKAARLAVRAALIAANIGLIVWNVIVISGVLM